MKNYASAYWLIAVLAIVFVSGFCSCSTQKNTAATRSFHATKTKYNIYYNGHTAYEEGLKAIDKANKDDYTHLIPLYPISNKATQNAATSQMERTIEKCRKCIKLHSIKSKPKPDPKKSSDPAYKAWLQQEEFNKNMHLAWLQLGQAEFHKGDFIGAIGTFNYIIRHYEYDKDMVAQCQLWVVRAYAELDWLYEAEDAFKRVQAENLSRKHAWLYSAVAAELKLKTGQAKEAVPFLKIALPEESQLERIRYTFVLAQISENQGDRNAALGYYRRVVRLNPAADIRWQAEVKCMELSGDVKKLLKSAKQYKNRDRLDQLYGAVGDVYLHKKDTVKALAYYQLGIDEATQTGDAKAGILLKAGDLYYAQREYEKAEPCYTEAVNLLQAGSKDLKHCQKRAEVLGDLVLELKTVALQDSLQHLATLSEEEQLAIVNKIIEDLLKAEQEAAQAAAQAERQQLNGHGLATLNTQGMIGGGGGSGEWYFYNQQLIRQGKQTFTQRWGNRPLEDNWRRLNKTMAVAVSEETGDFEKDSIGNDSIGAGEDRVTIPLSTDTHDPQYYLQQIPRTEEEVTASNTLISNALYNLIGIYQDRVEDEELAMETYEEFRRRFPTDERLLEVYYRFYLTCLKRQDTVCAEQYKQLLISEFPESVEATIVRDERYFDNLRRMAAEQGPIYEQTYAYFRASQLDSVKVMVSYANEQFPLSPLMPKFLFLNAIAVAKTEGQEAFIERLQELVARYPESEPGTNAKTMLAMMTGGRETSNDSTTSSLLDRRAEQALAELDENLQNDSIQFSKERKEPSVLLLLVTAEEGEVNRLLYEIALYNFSQFLIKEFDLRVLQSYGTLAQSAIEISGFENMDEVEWYEQLLLHNPDISNLLNELGVKFVGITKTNFPLLYHPFSLEDYEESK